MAGTAPTSSLRAERELMQTLLELIRQEQQYLVAADIENLPGLMARKAGLTAQLTALAAQRHAALAEIGGAASDAGMAAWLAGSGDEAERALWAELLSVTREAKESNRLNGMLINKHLAHTQGALNTLRPQSQGGTFYGPSGQTTGAAAPRRYIVG